MPAYNFKKEFAQPVENGFAEASGQPLPWPDKPVKRCTIRKPRKRQTKPGDTIYGKVGMRTKNCRPLGEAVCQSVDGLTFFCRGNIYLRNRRWLENGEIIDLARADGFDNVEGLYAFLEMHYGFPAKLELIKW